VRSRSAQDIQDDIFRKMSADRKLEVGAQLWLLAKELDSDKINYAKNRPSASPRTNSRHS
jgi:hypothetical protein